jgi:hypothetical protein
MNPLFYSSTVEAINIIVILHNSEPLIEAYDTKEQGPTSALLPFNFPFAALPSSSPTSLSRPCIS